jgi:hypothetical protein
MEKGERRKERGERRKGDFCWIADYADYGDFVLASLVFLAKFTPKASFVTNYCLRPHSQRYWPVYEADLILIADPRFCGDPRSVSRASKGTKRERIF